MHGLRVKNYGTLELPPRPASPRGGPCAAPGCDNKVRQEQHCPKHLWRLKTHGTLTLPEQVRPPRKTTCDAPNCDKKRIHTSRWCSMHVKRLTTYGTLTPAFITAEDRFWRQVQRGGLGCWNWTGSAWMGYGSVSFKGRTRKAYRVAYELLVGPIPAGMTLDHLCQNPACVNPRHLEPVTAAENSRRAMLSRDFCKNGHPFDDENTRIKSGVRMCVTCRRVQAAEYRARRKAA